MLYSILISIGLLEVVLVVVLWVKHYYSTKPTYKVFAFFHPYCDGGGGGERVLWKTIEALLNDKEILKGYKVIIYSGESSKSDADIFKNVKSKFQISLSQEILSNIIIIKIKSTTLLEAKWYPVATMLGQSLGSIIVCLECMFRCSPDIFCDTIGAPFSYPLVSIFGAKVIAYVHYPTISTDMLQEVVERRPAYNNNGVIASSANISILKQRYYKIFTKLYSFAGNYASVVMVNSSWTEGHIKSLWNFTNASNRSTRHLVKVYPPCNVSFAESVSPRQKIILSVGQFRPEKDHMLQLRALSDFFKLPESERHRDLQLVMVGSTRNLDDEALVQKLRNETSTLGLNENVQFVVNAPYTELVEWLLKASIGIHTMWNEHFGISIVEMMAAGLIVIGHNSGGPKMDIITSVDDKNPLGYLASTSSQYANRILEILSKPESEREAIRTRCRASVERFSDEKFSKSIVRLIWGVMKK